MLEVRENERTEKAVAVSPTLPHRAIRARQVHHIRLKLPAAPWRIVLLHEFGQRDLVADEHAALVRILLNLVLPRDDVGVRRPVLERTRPEHSIVVIFDGIVNVDAPHIAVSGFDRLTDRLGQSRDRNGNRRAHLDIVLPEVAILTLTPHHDCKLRRNLADDGNPVVVLVVLHIMLPVVLHIMLPVSLRPITLRFLLPPHAPHPLPHGNLPIFILHFHIRPLVLVLFPSRVIHQVGFMHHALRHRRFSEPLTPPDALLPMPLLPRHRHVTTLQPPQLLPLTRRMLPIHSHQRILPQRPRPSLSLSHRRVELAHPILHQDTTRVALCRRIPLRHRRVPRRRHPLGYRAMPARDVQTSAHLGVHPSEPRRRRALLYVYVTASASSETSMTRFEDVLRHGAVVRLLLVHLRCNRVVRIIGAVMRHGIDPGVRSM
mmetsp:Transcript_1058/g.3265  ORF Transcript_1058/g.3265 Transcript_1058/m.3265 type:complete len:431 (+) Transcript_1058:482-1774(+)